MFLIKIPSLCTSGTFLGGFRPTVYQYYRGGSIISHRVVSQPHKPSIKWLSNALAVQHFEKVVWFYAFGNLRSWFFYLRLFFFLNEMVLRTSPRCSAQSSIAMAIRVTPNVYPRKFQVLLGFFVCDILFLFIFADIFLGLFP